MYGGGHQSSPLIMRLSLSFASLVRSGAYLSSRPQSGRGHPPRIAPPAVFVCPLNFHAKIKKCQKILNFRDY